MADEVKPNTDVSGAEPEDKTVKAGAEPVKDEDKAASSPAADKEEQVPWHKDQRWQDFQKNKKSLEAASSKLDKLLTDNDVDDVDDLIELINSGKKVVGKEVDLDNIETIIKKAQTLDKYEEHWRRQEELNKRKGEDPKETIARLERENEEVKKTQARERQAKREAEEAAKAVAYYEGEVKNLLEDKEDLSDSEKEFLAWSLGVGNECNDIQVTDRKAIKRVVSGGIKKYTELIKSIKEQGIKEYLAGKKEIPIVPSGGSTPASDQQKPTLKSAAARLQAFKEMMGGKK